MVPTWHEVAAHAMRDFPSAEYFAWVSDHDRWEPTWLARLVGELDAHPACVLAYPLAPRIDEYGQPGPKEPRTFDTVGITAMRDRWSYFCHEGVGAGDMVYGLMRVSPLRAAGIFRPVLRPDRLLIAELTLYGQILQVQEPLWIRRQAAVASPLRQRVTLFASGAPWWFALPPWIQHALVLAREYGRADAPVRIPRLGLAWMLLLYQVTYVVRHIRKSETSHRVHRGVDNVHWVKKVIKRTVRHTVYWILVEGRWLWGRTKRLGRRTLYETLVATHALVGRLRRVRRRATYQLLMLTHRLGLRTRNVEPGPRSGGDRAR
jgi:hypothetical protein